MPKQCILEPNKVCTNCGECNMCDLNPSKVCNNCGKCLDLEGYDSKAIKINEIIEDPTSKEDIEVELDALENKEDEDIVEKYASYNKDLEKGDIKVEYIDDIDGLNEFLQNEEHEEKGMKEAFPGLFIFDTKNNNKK